MTTIYGYRNVAYFAGARAEGYARWYSTRAARDAALEHLRQNAVDHGLASSASQAGIYPVERRVAKADLADVMEEIEAAGFAQT